MIAKTMAEFIQELEKATTALKQEAKGSVSIVSGCELFMRFVTRAASDSAEVPFILIFFHHNLYTYVRIIQRISVDSSDA